MVTNTRIGVGDIVMKVLIRGISNIRTKKIPPIAIQNHNRVSARRSIRSAKAQKRERTLDLHYQTAYHYHYNSGTSTFSKSSKSNYTIAADEDHPQTTRRPGMRPRTGTRSSFRILAAMVATVRWLLSTSCPHLAKAVKVSVVKGAKALVGKAITKVVAVRLEVAAKVSMEKVVLAKVVGSSLHLGMVVSVSLHLHEMWVGHHHRHHRHACNLAPVT